MHAQIPYSGQRSISSATSAGSMQCSTSSQQLVVPSVIPKTAVRKLVVVPPLLNTPAVNGNLYLHPNSNRPSTRLASSLSTPDHSPLERTPSAGSKVPIGATHRATSASAISDGMRASDYDDDDDEECDDDIGGDSDQEDGAFGDEGGEPDEYSDDETEFSGLSGRYTRDSRSSAATSTQMSLTASVSSPAGSSASLVKKPPLPQRKLSQQPVPTTTQSFLRPSRFHNVPATIRFCLPSEKIQKPKRSTRKLLKWCHNSLIPKVIRKILLNSYFQIVPEYDFWVGYWGKHLRSTSFHTIRPHQKVNHFPGTFHMGRKDRLWSHLHRNLVMFGHEEFNLRRCIMPKTYILPRDLKSLKQRMKDSSSHVQKFILKPPASARGAGIQVIHRFAQVPRKQSLIAQEYIEKPFLIDGSKFDLRLYVYITSFNPLRLYLYEDGLVRFASLKYSESLKSVDNKFMHLTNYSVNKFAPDTPHGDNTLQKSETGFKWRVRDLWRYLAKQNHDVRHLMEQIVDLILKTVISCEGSINTFVKQHAKFPFTCHELFGFDIILDESLKPWLLEVNISPSLQSSSELDIETKSRLARDVLNIAGVLLPTSHLPQVKRDIPSPVTKEKSKSGSCPPNLCNMSASASAPVTLTSPQSDYRIKLHSETSSDEQAKQNYYVRQFNEKDQMVTDSTIIDCLTPADVRILVELEDEWERRGGFTRLFPSPFSSSYLRFFERPRYYNLLLDKWIQQYYHVRETGVNYLAALCERGLHLDADTKNIAHQWLNRRRCKDALIPPHLSSYRPTDNNAHHTRTNSTTSSNTRRTHSRANSPTMPYAPRRLSTNNTLYQTSITPTGTSTSGNSSAAASCYHNLLSKKKSASPSVGSTRSITSKKGTK